MTHRFVVPARAPARVLTAALVAAALATQSCAAPTLRSAGLPLSPRFAASELVTLPVPAGANAGTGEISPDGSRFAYEAGLNRWTGQIWALDIGAARARRRAAGEGRRSGPAWSPDGTRLVFSSTSSTVHGDERGRDGIFVVELESGEERRVFRPGSRWDFVHAPRWFGRDSILFSYARGALFSVTERWIVAADGTGARHVEDASRYLVRSPSGSRVFFAHCCDSWEQGLWLASNHGDDRRGQRCLAGPFGYGVRAVWSSDGQRVFFSGRPPHRDSVRTLWVAELTGGGARIDRPPGAVMRISESDAGVLAVQLRTRIDSAGGGPASLWLVSDTEVETLAGHRLEACPSVDPAASALARESGITGELRIRETFRLDEFPFREFRVDYWREDGARKRRTGIAVDGHTGWIRGECKVFQDFGDVACPITLDDGQPSGVTFVPRPDEAVLWSRRFLDYLAEAHRDRWWVRVLLRAPALPPRALESLVAGARYDGLLVEDSRVRERLDWLLDIWRRRRSSQVGYEAFEALWQRGAAIVENPAMPREFLRELAVRVRLGGPPARPRSSDSLMAAIARALLAHPWARRQTDVLLALAQVSPDVDSTVYRFAGLRLLADPSLSGDTLRSVVANLAAYPPLAERLFADRRITGNQRALAALARTPWQEWGVAERARRLLRVLWEEEDRAARAGTPVVPLPIALPDAWAGSVDLGHPHAVRRALANLDPISRRVPPLVRSRASRSTITGALCGRAANPDENESELLHMAEGAVYATSTRLAACLLDNPAIRSHPFVLRALATMIDVNHDERWPVPGAPTIEEIRMRARDLLDAPASRNG